ncbi:MAG: portal protein, partial [Candidatus Ranarchaeia archaeon]
MADLSVFKRLKKLFSTDVIIRNVGGKKLKVVDTQRIQYATDRNSLRDRFNRLRSSTYNLHNRDMSMAYQAARLELFRDYDTMDMDPILASALDIYADECTTESEVGNVLTIRSDDDNIRSILENLFYEILNVEFNLWSWTRNMCKYGDFFLKMEISPEYGVYSVEPISAYEITRIEGLDPENKNYVKFQHDGAFGGQEFENYEIAHFRLLSDSNFLPYGRSQIEPARRVWKQLSLMEDAMLINRIMRAPERRIFYVDIGNIPPSDVDTYMERLINKMKKVPFIDERTGDYNLRFNLQNMIEDFYLPVRGGDSGTRIENLPGLEWTGIDDLEYVKNKMMAALKIPKAFLGYEEGISGKATLAAEDVRFAKTIQRVQKIIVSELTKIAIIHLYVQGYTDASLVNFELKLTNPSTIFEQEKVALWGDKMNVAGDMYERKFFSKRWIMENVFDVSKDEREEIDAEIVEDTKANYRLQTIEEEGNDPASDVPKIGDQAGSGEDDGMGGGFDDFGGGGGGFDDFGGGDMGGDLFEGDIPKEGDDTRPDDVQKDQALSGKVNTNQSVERKRNDKQRLGYVEDPLGKNASNVKKVTEKPWDERFGLTEKTIVSISKELKSIDKKFQPKKSLLDEGNILE